MGREGRLTEKKKGGEEKRKGTKREEGERLNANSGYKRVISAGLATTCAELSCCPDAACPIHQSYPIGSIHWLKL
jgi:hypothetical protein